MGELRGTPKEAEINALKVSEVGTMYQTQVDLQALVNLDQELSHLLQQFKQTRYHMHSDKKSVIKSIHDVFDNLVNALEERREEVLQEVKKEYKVQTTELEDMQRSLIAVQLRCRNIFPGKVPGPAMDYVKQLEKILDF